MRRGSVAVPLTNHFNQPCLYVYILPRSWHSFSQHGAGEQAGKGNGLIDAKELEELVAEMAQAKRDKRILLWMVAGMVLMTLCLIGALGGVTYVVVVQAEKL